MAQIIALAFQFLIPIVSAIIKKWMASEAEKAQWDQRIKELTKAYNEGVLEAAELKAKYRAQRDRIKEEIAKKWKPSQNSGNE